MPRRAKPADHAMAFIAFLPPMVTALSGGAPNCLVVRRRKSTAADRSCSRSCPASLILALALLIAAMEGNHARGPSDRSRAHDGRRLPYPTPMRRGED